jgi:acetylornithine/N-succinyldiaminopimelate aminotransferase
MLPVPPGEAAHFVSAAPIVAARRSRAKAVTSHLLPTFARVDLAFERGEGVWLVATNGERYLDFTSGVAVNALGHAHPHLVAALTEQAQKLWHVSNLYQIPEAERAAERLCEASFADFVFFCNSGAEAMECAIKMARKYQAANLTPERYRIITFEGAFHGRTLATLAAGGQQKYLEGFGPAVDGFDQVPFNDLKAVKQAIGGETAAILIEPIMGEGGVRVVEPSFLRSLRAGVTPDIMALAKALGGGFPVGACLATSDAAKGMTPGTHGSTFGGNPLAMSATNAVLDVMLAPGFFDHVQRIALLFKQRLAEIKDRYPAIIAELRGEGLLVGLRLLVPVAELVDALRAERMITVAAGDNVVRLLPPLIVSEQEIAEGIARLDRACARLSRTPSQKPKHEVAG